jgi:stress-induced morphogen
MVALGNLEMPDPDRVKAQLVAAFPGAEVEIVDLTGTQDHFQARVVASQFLGKSRVDQHKMVYAALGEWMKGAIHALALTTSTPNNSSERQP